MEVDDDDICIICNKNIVDSESVKKISGDTLKKYISVSVKLKDDKDKYMRSRSFLYVHENCTKHYTEKSRIKVKVSRLVQSNADFNERNLRSKNDFDFNNLCFFCSSDASDDFIKKQQKKSPHYRIKVIKVPAESKMKENILKEINNVYNLSSKNIIDRLSSIPADLYDVNARYHDKCYLNFCKIKATRNFQ